MSTRITIPDDLADLLERRRMADGLPSMEAVAEQLIRAQLNLNSSVPYSVAELRLLIDEAEASGPPEPWNASTFRAEVLRRHAANKAR